MKLMCLLISVIALNSAQASYYATHCSNSTGSVKWETGHNSNTISIQHYNSEGEQFKKIAFHKVDVQMEKEIVIKEERDRRCGYSGYTKIYAGKVVITPAGDFPDALDFLGEEKELKTEVICTHHMNGRAPCPE